MKVLIKKLWLKDWKLGQPETIKICGFISGFELYWIFLKKSFQQKPWKSSTPLNLSNHLYNYIPKLPSPKTNHTYSFKTIKRILPLIHKFSQRNLRHIQTKLKLLCTRNIYLSTKLATINWPLGNLVILIFTEEKLCLMCFLQFIELFWWSCGQVFHEKLKESPQRARNKNWLRFSFAAYPCRILQTNIYNCINNLST